MAEKDKIITLSNVTKVFNKNLTVVDNISFFIRKGEFVTILGPSGCGKTTTLRMIAGFDIPTSGDILLNGQDITSIPPYKRPINTVFQRYALFPHLDVYENVAFGLRLKKIPVALMDKDGKPILKINKAKIKDLKSKIKFLTKDNIISEEEKNERISVLEKEVEYLYENPEQAYKYRKLSEKEIDEKVIKALSVVDLEELEDRDISTLSGGQQQRVAIARAICNEPQILLLDEPLGALDLKMRKDMQLELKEMHKKLGITFIYVTHDQEEALTMSDTIIIMNDGIIQQIGTPTDIYNEPKNAFVADFIGESNIYNATIVDKLKVKFLNHIFTCVDDFEPNTKVDVVVRPEDIKLSKVEKESSVKGHIISKVFKGVHYQYVVMVGKAEVLAKSTKNFDENADIFFTIEADDIHLMKKPETQNLFIDAIITKNNELELDDDVLLDIDITKLIANSKVDEDGYLVVNNKKYDLTDAKVNATVNPHHIEITDNLEDVTLKGRIASSVYKGDHYAYTVRISEEIDFIVDNPYTYNLNDIVGLKIKKEDVAIKLKGTIEQYEI